MGYKVLAINPGSTSTKVALYDEERPLLDLTLRHTTEELNNCFLSPMILLRFGLNSLITNWIS